MIQRCFVGGIQFPTAWLLFILACGTLIAVERFWVRQWDKAWRERWERKHGRSLDTLRTRKARFLKVFRLGWAVGGAFIVGSEILIGLAVFAPAIRGVTLTDLQILEFCRRTEAVILFFCIFLVGGALAVRNLKSGLKKLDELLGRSP